MLELLSLSEKLNRGPTWNLSLKGPIVPRSFHVDTESDPYREHQHLVVGMNGMPVSTAEVWWSVSLTYISYMDYLLSYDV